MKLVDVELVQNEDKSYSICIGDGEKGKLVDVLKKTGANKILLVTNETVYELYSEIFPQLFEKSSLKVEYCILPDGEAYKNKTSLETILACAFECKLERKDAMVAFGGGVIGDITGFAASVYLRGVNFVQMPTTILAQVDSSVGGKVAINTPYGKNLIGAFYQPKAVVSDLGFLKTLPKREILTGLSEVVKYAFIEKVCGIEFIDFAKFLYSNSKSILSLDFEKTELLIEHSCKLKAAVVRQDEKEQGLRAVLNFGHTVGHAIEKATSYNVFTHGEAVAIGMRAAMLISLRMGKINEEYYRFSIDLLNSFGLNYNIPKNISLEKIQEALTYDKKVKDGVIRFVLPVGYAMVEIVDNVDADLLNGVLKELY